MMYQKYPSIEKARRLSEATLEEIRKNLPDIDPDVSIVVNGSLARRELTSQSDFDAYSIYKRSSAAQAHEVFEKINNSVQLRKFAADGNFGTPIKQMHFFRNIGGQKDSNKKLTLRMLLLLESICIGNNKTYNETIEKLINRYIREDIRVDQISRFLLNDFIRYYRTICIDFEFKTAEQNKPWGIRYAKLIFSRKLLYVSGVIMCAELAGKSAGSKRALLREFVGKSPIDRLSEALGGGVDRVLQEYEYFLSVLDDEQAREALGGVQPERYTHTEQFVELKKRGHNFSRALIEALRNTYSDEHAVHEALLL